MADAALPAGLDFDAVFLFVDFLLDFVAVVRAAFFFVLVLALVFVFLLVLGWLFFADFFFVFATFADFDADFLADFLTVALPDLAGDFLRVVERVEAFFFDFDPGFALVAALCFAARGRAADDFFFFVATVAVLARRTHGAVRRNSSKYKGLCLPATGNLVNHTGSITLRQCVSRWVDPVEHRPTKLRIIPGGLWLSSHRDATDIMLSSGLG